MGEDLQGLLLHLHLTFEDIDQVLRGDHEFARAVFFRGSEILWQTLRGEPARRVRFQFIAIAALNLRWQLCRGTSRTDAFGAEQPIERERKSTAVYRQILRTGMACSWASYTGRCCRHRARRWNGKKVADTIGANHLHAWPSAYLHDHSRGTHFCVRRLKLVDPLARDIDAALPSRVGEKHVSIIEKRGHLSSLQPAMYTENASD